MTIWHRRILYIIFMLAFFIGAPTLIFYTSGYRYNFKKGLVQKTGIVFIESDPKKADVYFNNKLQKKKTPMQIDNLLANEYKLRIEKAGYHPWEKIVQVTEGYTTNIQYIKLFREDPKLTNILEEEIINAKFNQIGDKIIFQDTNGKIHLYNLREKNNTVLLGDEYGIEDFNFETNDNIVSAKTKRGFLIIDLSNPKEIITIDQSLNPYIDSIKMDYYYSSYSAYYLKGAELFKYNLINNSNDKILPYSISDYLVRGSAIYALTNDSLNQTFLRKIDLLDNSHPTEIGNFAMSEDYKIKDVNEYFITLFDNTRKRLLVFNLKNSNKMAVQNVEGWQWSKNGKELIYYTKSELWVYKTEEGEDRRILLTRLSDSVNKIAWHPLDTHIFYTNGERINVIENLGDNRYETELLSADRIFDFVLDSKGENIYFWGEIGNQKGVFMGEMQ